MSTTTTQPNQIDVIKDPVTGSQFSRDPSVAGNTYAPFQGNTLAPASLPAISSTPMVDTTKPIDASKLNAPPTQTPPPVDTSTAQNALSASVNSTADTAYTAQQQSAQDAATTAAPVPAKNALQSVLDKIMSDSSALGRKGQATLDAQAKEGVDTKKKQLDQIDQQILSKTRTYDKQIQAIQTQPGILADVANAKIAEVERQKNSELADLSIQRYAANGDYQTAFDIAQKKVAAEFEPIQNEIDTLKTYYQLAQNDMTESEKVQAQATIQAKQAQADFERQKQLADYQEKIKQNDPLYLAQVANTRANTANTYSSISTRNAAATINGKPQTATQTQVQGYADRTKEADSIIGNVGSQFASSSFGNQVASSGIVPNFLKSSDRQKYEQAQRNFVNAVLRRESGAAISPSEFDNAAKQYFPQPGDSPEVIDQKSANRQTTINNLYQQANIPQPVSAGDVIQDGNGNQYQVGQDGNTLIPL